MAQAETASSEHTLTAGPTRVYRPPWETRFVPPLAPNSSERDIPYARLVALGAMVAGATATADHRREHRALEGARRRVEQIREGHVARARAHRAGRFSRGKGRFRGHRRAQQGGHSRRLG